MIHPDPTRPPALYMIRGSLWLIRSTWLIRVTSAGLEETLGERGRRVGYNRAMKAFVGTKFIRLFGYAQSELLTTGKAVETRHD